jgi:hypothetical protein
MARIDLRRRNRRAIGDDAAFDGQPSNDGIHMLEVDETDPDHPCTDVSLYAPDLDLLAYMLQDLRSLLRANDAGKVDLIAHEPKFYEVHGMRRRIVVCEPERIRVRNRVCVVGFFGERRDADGERPLDELEVGLLREFRGYPGILSYSSIELANDYWTNLVVHNVPDDSDAWRGNTAHAHAVAVSPEIYASVRIHNGHLDDGVASSQAIVVDRTKYWDYRDEPTWHAVREFDPPMQRTRRQVARRQPD